MWNYMQCLRKSVHGPRGYFLVEDGTNNLLDTQSRFISRENRSVDPSTELFFINPQSELYPQFKQVTLQCYISRQKKQQHNNDQQSTTEQMGLIYRIQEKRQT